MTEPWPQDAKVYQPYEADQILLPENASCLAVKAYLKMCNLPFELVSRPNAEFMSTGGRLTKLPFLRAGATIIAEFEPIVRFVEQKGNGLCKWQDEDEKFDVRAYILLVENTFTMAEIYISFVNKTVYDAVTAPRYGSVFPWPLNIWQNFQKRRNAMRMLRVYQWDNMNMEDVIAKVTKCCEILTMKLEENPEPFFCSHEPCELDAAAFGHLYTILTTKLPNMELAETVKKFKPLVDYCHYIEHKYFQMK